MLALALALFGFVLAPLTHTLTHAHGHGHTHEGAPADNHGGNSLAHFTLATDEAPTAESSCVVRLAVRLEQAGEAPSPALQERRRSEQAQGPPAHG